MQNSFRNVGHPVRFGAAQHLAHRHGADLRSPEGGAWRPLQSERRLPTRPRTEQSSARPGAARLVREESVVWERRITFAGHTRTRKHVARLLVWRRLPGAHTRGAPSVAGPVRGAVRAHAERSAGIYLNLLDTCYTGR
jgi:hypothetical protein